MIPFLGARAVTLYRYGAATFSAGRYLPPVPVASVVTMTIDPAPKNRSVVLPSGVQAPIDITAVCYSEVLAASDVSGQIADQIVQDGKTYQVITATRCPAFLGQPVHWYVEGTQVQPIVVVPA